MTNVRFDWQAGDNYLFRIDRIVMAFDSLEVCSVLEQVSLQTSFLKFEIKCLHLSKKWKKKSSSINAPSQIEL